MKQMCVQMRMPSADVPATMLEWLEDSLPFDITVRTGRGFMGQRRVVFSVYGSTQTDIMAKLEALETFIDQHQLRNNIEQ